MGLLSRAAIESASDLGYEEIEVPEWGGSVRLRKMTAGEHAELGQVYESIPKAEAPFYVLAKVLVDEHNAPLFPGDEGRKAIAAKAGDVVLRLSRAASKLNKLDKDDVEDLAKN